MSVVSRLSESDKQRLRDEALASAKRHGYCSEAEKVLNDLGLVAPPKTIKVAVELEFAVDEDGHSVIVNSDRLSYKSHSGKGKLVGVRITDGKPAHRGVYS